MAAANPLQSLRDEASCSICLEYFKDPVSIECGHNFCSGCITQCWEGLDSDFPCPQCRETSQSKLLRLNRQLGNMVAIAKELHLPSVKPQEENLCREHEEKLKLFCEEDQKPICVICREARDHKPHTVRPIREAAQEYKDKFQSHLDAMKRELEDLLGLQRKEEKDLKELEEKFKSQRERIVSEFEMLQQYLEKEKGCFLASLEEEEKEILKRMKGNVTQLEEQHSSLSNMITEIEEKCQQQDVELLKDVRSTLSRCENVNVQKPEAETPEEAKNIWSLCRRHADLRETISEFRERFPAELDWRRARSFAGAVTLDPDSAHRKLILSEAGRSARHTDTAQALPDTPERFNPVCGVLGRERLTSGRHYWEVEVGGKRAWDLGVCDESVSRKGKITLAPEKGYWAVTLRGGDQYWAGTSPYYDTPLTPRARPRAVGVFLDYEAGRLSVYSVEGRSLLFTFPRASFPRTLRPYFSPGLSAADPPGDRGLRSAAQSRLSPQRQQRPLLITIAGASESSSP